MKVVVKGQWIRTPAPLADIRNRAHTQAGIGVTMGVILVHEEFSTREIWPLECLHCRHVWREEYLVRRLTDGHGHDVVVWTRSGVLVQPPWSGVRCPGCGDSSVKAFPVGDRSHRAAAPGAPAPDPAAGSTPAPLPASGGVSAPPGASVPAPDPALPEASAPPGVSVPAPVPAPVPDLVPVPVGASVRAEKTRARVTRVRARVARVRVCVRGPASGRRRPPVLRYALAGIAVLLLVGFELVERVVMHH
ncbi:MULTISPECIES: hypothetical protein [Streptosporangium]|uniref:Zinc-ribbon domain-containing protein n=1 Tax=Streptosporangium brasiliense TaxID=47480 RepID=A0ABT9REQ8_9ACTN|nr:hypothetical protein [Streptosporangium brasiliense]MDP9866870.1 hypothetical protein [Streptosporangium brasiliense]